MARNGIYMKFWSRMIQQHFFSLKILVTFAHHINYYLNKYRSFIVVTWFYRLVYNNFRTKTSHGALEIL